MVRQPVQFNGRIVRSEFQKMAGRTACPAEIPGQAIPARRLEGLDQRDDVVASGMSAEAVAEKGQSIIPAPVPVKQDFVAVRRGKGLALARQRRFMPELRRENRLDMPSAKRPAGCSVG